jgi:hypothetical protein
MLQTEALPIKLDREGKGNEPIQMTAKTRGFLYSFLIPKVYVLCEHPLNDQAPADGCRRPYLPLSIPPSPPPPPQLRKALETIQ